MKEAEIVTSIMKYLKSVPRCFCWKEHGGMYGTAGIPDIIACIDGQFFGFEVKTETGKATALQEATIRKILVAGGTAIVVRSVDEVRRIVEGNLHGYGICIHCGQLFEKTGSRQQYCNLAQCQRARNAKNQRNHRKRLVKAKTL